MLIRPAIALSLLIGCIGYASGKERTTEQMRAYAERRIANAEEEQLTAFIKGLDVDADGKITDAEFARRIEVFQ
ncbi:MAG: hypothetical protein AAGI63_03575, partial [Planctomycetota bacterium]